MFHKKKEEEEKENKNLDTTLTTINWLTLFYSTELMNMDVELDRRMLDFIVGLDTEFSELVEGSHLYTSSVKLDR